MAHFSNKMYSLAQKRKKTIFTNFYLEYFFTHLLYNYINDVNETLAVYFELT